MLQNLRMLRNDMINNNWTICSFLFRYNGVRYIVLVKRFIRNEQRESEYALVKLHFMKENDLNDDLQVEANTKGLIIDARALRDYFGIDYQENLGDILQQFTARLGDAIPEAVADNTTEIERMAMVYSLCISDAENPNRIYCIGVRRNPDGCHRSEFNTDKTRLLRPTLFEAFRDDARISFCYSEDKDRERTDVEIMRDIAINN